jgi:peptidoglycan/LPS O-acetylase OafA/YrhL
MNHRNNFDLLRLVAAVQVMLTHGIAHLKLELPEIIDRAINAFPGVPIFFVVSGFVIAGSYGRQRSIGDYAFNRARRIYPALWVNLLGITVLLAIVGNLNFGPDHLRFWIWHAVAFVFGSDYIASQNLGSIYGGNGPLPFYPSGVLWTLPVEIGFYLLAPLILMKRLASRRLAGLSVALWLVASLAFFWLVPREGDLIIFVGLYLWIFLLGTAAKVYWDRVQHLFMGKAAFWLAAHAGLTVLILSWTGALPVYVVPKWLNVLHTCTLAGLTLSAAFTAPWVTERMLRGNDISYGLYLWHMPVFCTFMIAGLVGDWQWFACASALATVLATASMILIERPASKLRRRGKAANQLRSASIN